MIRRNGLLPPEAPEFSTYLDADLLNYGYAMLASSVDLLDEGQDLDLEIPGLVREGLIQGSYALEAATRNAAETDDLAFHGLIAGAASHLGGYAARAFSLIRASRRSGRLAPMEETLADLAMRDLRSIEDRARLFRSSPNLLDNVLLATLEAEADELEQTVEASLGPVLLLLTENYLAAVSSALFAIEIDNEELLAASLDDLQLGEQASMDAGAPGPWWVYRLTRPLLRDLFDTSLQLNIPHSPPAGASVSDARWRYLRNTFIEALLARSRAEIDLWPSQLHVVQHVFTNPRDLVVALPTSAGKTRIAELAVLACLAQGRRTVYVTPLRALSAQTERVLARTFTPMGIGVSSLYGSTGTSTFDEDTLHSSPIVVATPEKLDFALRSDPTVLDDVGLVVLDEGHMIGATEREVRYEAQIQRLLRRADASTRRILCLSAVFPSGDDLDDFVAWITREGPEGLHRESWRPTQQRFGLVEWRSDHARLIITLGNEQPFIPRYLESQPPTGRRRNPFPHDQRELVIATAWRLVEEGQTALIFCPQRNSVEPYARQIVKLFDQGLIPSLSVPDVDLHDALAVGTEWFGADHPILQCLKLGVAIHHGALPGPFRREIERLLQSGGLRVTVASPTLAQGLNLSASAVLFHGLRRGRELLKGSEFANVIGRAGRAFVDTEGLVLYPVHQPRESLRRDWLQLTQGDGGKALRSGLIETGVALLRRMYRAHDEHSLEGFVDYITGGPDWTLPVVANETAEAHATAVGEWRANLSLLDISILSVVGDVDLVDDPDLATQALIDALHDSLWDRQLRRQDELQANAVRSLVSSRARHLWRTSTPSQRRGWFLAGLGADAGDELSRLSESIVALTGAVEAAIADGDEDAAAAGITSLAEIVFSISAFTPEALCDDWRTVLRQWVSGSPLAELPGDRVAMAQFVESDLVYRLVWGLEAAKVYEMAQGRDTEGLTGAVVASIETGTFNRAASVLIRSGFDHRIAAITAVTTTGADFDSAASMREWIRHLDPTVAADPGWPSEDSRSAWDQFASRARAVRNEKWTPKREVIESVRWDSRAPDPDEWLRATMKDPSTAEIWSPGFDRLGEVEVALNPSRVGILRAQSTSAGGVSLYYRGPGDLRAPSQGSEA